MDLFLLTEFLFSYSGQIFTVGESSSVEKEVDSTSAVNAVYQDKTNILFSVMS